MKIKITMDDLRKGKYRQLSENETAELSRHTLSKEQMQSMAQFLYEIMIRSKEV